MHCVAVIWAFAVLIAGVLSADSAPQPIVIPASEYFEGNDGPWSTFDIRVGTPEQYMRVLVSTAAPESLVALSEYGCSTPVFTTVPPDCAVSRGNLFDLKQSSSWLDVGTYGINQNGVGLEANLGYNQPADFGLEHLGIGLNGPSLDNQTVGGIATAEPFYLGIFGIGTQPLNFSTLGNSSSPSFLTTLKQQNKIPSLSWSYTAGAKYRLKQVYGQLIFSGYDTSRFKENTVSFTMADDLTRDLVVSLQSISYSGSSSTTLLSESIDIFIDSTDPNIWLPSAACDAFEKAFGLTLDQKTGLYLVNDTYHNTLLDTNAQVSFRLSDVKLGGDTVSIVLPYAAFDLTAEYPLVDNSSHYFPLKRANDSTQYTLGRTFLQEAYLSADYERKVFNVSACVWNEGAEENIVTISSKDSNPNANGDSGSGSNSGSGSGSSSSGGSNLSNGAIAGIVVACVVVGLLIIAAIIYTILRKRRKWLKKGFAVARTSRDPDPSESVEKGPVFNSGQRSTSENSSAPWSAADVSAPRSTAGNSVSATDSPARLLAVHPSVGSGSTPELDGNDTHVRPSRELDGKEMDPIAENPGVYELPGSQVVGGGNRGTVPSRGPSTMGSTPSNEREVGTDSPPSPYVSTLDTIWGQDDRANPELVSPTTPARHRY